MKLCLRLLGVAVFVFVTFVEAENATEEIGMTEDEIMGNPMSIGINAEVAEEDKVVKEPVSVTVRAPRLPQVFHGLVQVNVGSIQAANEMEGANAFIVADFEAVRVLALHVLRIELPYSIGSPGVSLWHWLPQATATGQASTVKGQKCELFELTGLQGSGIHTLRACLEVTMPEDAAEKAEDGPIEAEVRPLLFQAVWGRDEDGAPLSDGAEGITVIFFSFVPGVPSGCESLKSPVKEGSLDADEVFKVDWRFCHDLYGILPQHLDPLTKEPLPDDDPPSLPSAFTASLIVHPMGRSMTRDRTLAAYSGTLKYDERIGAVWTEAGEDGGSALVRIDMGLHFLEVDGTCVVTKLPKIPEKTPVWLPWLSKAVQGPRQRPGRSNQHCQLWYSGSMSVCVNEDGTVAEAVNGRAHQVARVSNWNVVQDSDGSWYDVPAACQGKTPQDPDPYAGLLMPYALHSWANQEKLA